MRTVPLFSHASLLCLCAVLIASPLATRAAPPAAKRVVPAAVTPVTIGKVRYEAVHATRVRGLPQAGGYVAAIDRRTGAELWLQRIYETKYDPLLEEDVQDVFIRSLRRGPGGKTLEIVDERGRCYQLTLASRAVWPCCAAGQSRDPACSTPPAREPR